MNIKDSALLLSGISLAIIAYEIHVMNRHGIEIIKEKVLEILFKINSSWVFKK